MNNIPLQAAKFGSHTRLIGLLLVILGVTGFFLPELMSLGLALFMAWLLLIGGLLWAIHSFKYSANHIMDWIKPVLLLIIGGLMLFYPLTGIAAFGLLLAVYLLLDAFGSFSMAQSLFPIRGWGWMAFNGSVSLLLALLFLIGWPATSLWLVGLYISISLFLDGAALLAIGMAIRKADKP